MAETKKKTTAKKKPAVKKTSDAKESKKVTKAVNKKANNTNKATKKTENKKQEKKQDNKVSKKEETMKTITYVLGILFVVLLIFTIVSYMNDRTSSSNENINSDSLLDNSIVLTIVEDPICEHCQVDLFAQQIKGNLIPNLTVNKVPYDSEEGLAILDELGSSSVPIFIFNDNIESLDNWSTLIAPAFNQFMLDGKKVYTLREELVQTKVIVNNLAIGENSIVIGNETAKVRVIEFRDLGSPLTSLAIGDQKIFEELSGKIPQDYIAPVPEIMKNYVESGKVMYVILNTPNVALNPSIKDVHIATLCAYEQDSYEEFLEVLFENRSSWSFSSNYKGSMINISKDLGLDSSKFEICMDSEDLNKQIDFEISLFNDLNFVEAPMYLVNRNLISGPQDYRVFEFLIEKELNS